MENNFEMRLTPLLSNVIIKEVSQKLANQLLSKFKEQTKDDDSVIMSMINKFDQYKEGLDVSKRDITKYEYNQLKSLIIGKEMEKAASTAITKLKKKWDVLKKNNPELYQYSDATLKSLVTKFYDLYPILKPDQRDIMKYDYSTLNDFIRKNYGKLMNAAISKKMENDPDLTNKEALLFYIESFIQNRDRVPRGTKPILTMTFHELEQLVDGTLAQGDENAEKYQDGYEGIDRLYDKDNLIVFAPTSKDQCIRLKHGKTWCISRELREGGNLYYNYRLGNERTIYFVLDQDKPYKDVNFASVVLVDPYGRMALADGLALTVFDSRIVVTTCQAAGDHSSAGKTCKAPWRMASTTSSRCLRSTRQTIGTLKPKVVVSACSSCSSSMLPPSRTTSRSALSRRS